MNIVLCSTEQLDKFKEGERRFLDILGIPNALLTDESTISDFALEPVDRTRLYQALGYIVHEDQPIWKIARDLQK
jgi:hypothetical protein